MKVDGTCKSCGEPLPYSAVPRKDWRRLFCDDQCNLAYCLGAVRRHFEEGRSVIVESVMEGNNETLIGSRPEELCGCGKPTHRGMCSYRAAKARATREKNRGIVTSPASGGRKSFGTVAELKSMEAKLANDLAALRAVIQLFDAQ